MPNAIKVGATIDTDTTKVGAFIDTGITRE